MFKKTTFSFCLLLVFNLSFGQKIELKVAKQYLTELKPNGRLLVFLNKNEGIEPKDGTWPTPNSKSIIFAKNITNWDATEALNLSNIDNWESTESFDFNSIPYGTYNLQVLYAQSTLESRIDVPGDLFSQAQKITLNEALSISIELTEKVEERWLVSDPLLKEFTQKSKTLSDWWKKPMEVKAAILLPSAYFKNPNAKYPVRYNVAGYGGRYDRVNRLLKQEEFNSWWKSDDAPQVITVFLDGEGPFGDSYQLDSDNNGPYGENLIKELIPEIEKTYRTNGKRYTDGCSTGGWVSLALQLFYPETFDACYSYSPDPVDFNDMQLMNIYKDENAFVNEHGLEHPSMRTRDGEPVFTVSQEINYENIQGKNNTWATSGQQWGGWNAVYGSKLDEGTPTPLFDPKTGQINKSEVEHWEKYDLLKLLQDNWENLGPKIQGKVNIVMGDMDNFYLNNAMRNFDKYLKTTENPKSDAIVTFKATEGHCDSYSHKNVLQQIADKN